MTAMHLMRVSNTMNYTKKEFDDQLKEEAQFMKMLPTELQSNTQHKTQRDYISLKQQQDHFYRTPQDKSDDSNDNNEESEAYSEHHTTHDNDDITIQSADSDNGSNTQSTGSNKEVPQNLYLELDGNYLMGLVALLDGTSDSYWGMNLDNFYWGDNNAVINKRLAEVFAAISDYVHTEPSWVLMATYNMDKPKLVEPHASKVTP